jgi:putative intracellular protease/amidase
MLVVAGGGGVDAARHDPILVGWITAARAGARRVTSVCSGVYLRLRVLPDHTLASHPPTTLGSDRC